MLVIRESDAGQYGVGALILHRFPNGDERPIAYASWSLNSSERNHSQIKKAGITIIFPQVLHVSLWTQVHFTR